MAQLAPPGAGPEASPPPALSASLVALIEHLTVRIEALLSAVREYPEQLDALRRQQTAFATTLSALEQRRTEETGSALAASDRASASPSTDGLLAQLQRRLEELSRKDEAVGQTVQALAERVQLLAQGREAEVVSPRQLLAGAGVTAPSSETAADSGEEPFLVTIGSVRTEGEVRRLREAIEHLPSVAALDTSELDSGFVRFTVRLRESWPRSSFTRQMSWLEGLRLSLIFTGPDGLRADLLSSEAAPGKEKTSWLRRAMHRSGLAVRTTPTGRVADSGQ